MRKALFIALLFLNILSAGLLLLSYLSTLISPSYIWLFAFFGLFYPYFLAINFAFLIFWAMMLKKEVLISFIVILIGWNNLTDYFPVRNIFSNSRIQENVKGNYELRIISYNVRAFNIYEWVKDEEVKNNIINLIQSENPDVICLQEYYAEDAGPHFSDHVTRLFKDTPYHHIHYTYKTGKDSGYGMATLSRYPVIGKGSFHFSNTSNMCIYSDIAIDRDTFRIYNNHLQSLNFNKRNYDFIDSLRFRYDERQIEEIRDIMRRLKSAFIKRSIQVDAVSSHIQSSSYPVVVCGDFNDTPVSYAYRKMRSGLKDSFISSGAGSGNTYFGIFPSFRIDYIFHSQEFKTLGFERIEARLSDHYPIICHLQYDPLEE